MTARGTLEVDFRWFEMLRTAERKDAEGDMRNGTGSSSAKCLVLPAFFKFVLPHPLVLGHSATRPDDSD